MRQNRLVGRGVAEVFVLGKDVVDEGCSAAPMAEDEERVVLQGLVGKQLLILPVL